MTQSVNTVCLVITLCLFVCVILVSSLTHQTSKKTYFRNIKLRKEFAALMAEQLDGNFGQQAITFCSFLPQELYNSPGTSGLLRSTPIKLSQ